MASLFQATSFQAPRALPPAVRRAIAELKAEYPAFRPHEPARICYARFDHRPSPHTVKRVLAEEPSPVQVTRRYPPYAQIADATGRRVAIVRLHADGWPARSIAGYLEISRPTVYATPRRWLVEGLDGLDDKPHTHHRLTLKTDLAAIHAIRKLQVKPELGEFRIHAALRRLGIELSPRTCRRILALNRKLYGLPGPSKQSQAAGDALQGRSPTPVLDRRSALPGSPAGRRERLLPLDPGELQPAILASGISGTQDLTAFLIVLFAAMRQHGAPKRYYSLAEVAR